MEAITLDEGTKERLSKALDLIIKSQMTFRRKECTCILDVGSFVKSTKKEQIQTLKSLEHHSKRRKIGAVNQEEIDKLRSSLRSDLQKWPEYVF